jgi:hypothetical protein
MSIEATEPIAPGSVNDLIATGKYATFAEAARAQSEQMQAYRAGQMALLGVDADELHAMQFPH